MNSNTRAIVRILAAWAFAICAFFVFLAAVWVRWGFKGIAFCFAGSLLFAAMWAAFLQAGQADVAEDAQSKERDRQLRLSINDEERRLARWEGRSAGTPNRAERPLSPLGAHRRPRGAA